VGERFPPVQTSPGAHPASCTMGTGSFPGVKCGRGVTLTTHPLLEPRSWKSRSMTSPLWVTTGHATGLLYFTMATWRLQLYLPQMHSSEPPVRHATPSLEPGRLQRNSHALHLINRSLRIEQSFFFILFGATAPPPPRVPWPPHSRGF
jgi:hypothetical protein